MSIKFICINMYIHVNIHNFHNFCSLFFRCANFRCNKLHRSVVGNRPDALGAAGARRAPATAQWMNEASAGCVTCFKWCLCSYPFFCPTLTFSDLYFSVSRVWSHFAKEKRFWHFFHHVSITCRRFNTNGVIKHFTRPLYQRIVIKEKVQCLTWKVSNEFHSDSGWWFLPSRN